MQTKSITPARLLISAAAKNHKTQKTRKGFTLIELLVVVLIIGILAAIALPMYQRSVEKSRMAEAVSNLSVLNQANQRYYLATGSYCSRLSQLDVSIQGEIDSSGGVTGSYFYYRCYGGGASGVAADRLPLPINTVYNIFIRSSSSTNIMCNNYSGATDLQKSLCSKLNTAGVL